MSTFLEQLVLILTAMTLGAAVVGGGIRYALLPWLRTHLIAPVHETNRQVSVNGHSSPTPTLLDKVDTVQREVRNAAARADVAALTAAEVADEVRVAARMFEGHILLSSDDRGALWDAVHALQEKDPK